MQRRFGHACLLSHGRIVPTKSCNRTGTEVEHIRLMKKDDVSDVNMTMIVMRVVHDGCVAVLTQHCCTSWQHCPVPRLGAAVVWAM